MRLSILTFCLFGLFIFNTSATQAVVITNHPVEDSETRAVRNFHAIASGGSFNVVVKMGDEESLKIEASDEDLQRIEAIVQNGTLKIRYKRDFKNWNSSANQVNIYITAKKLDGLMLSGSGKITLDGVISSASADIQLSGSGEITAALETQSANVGVSGSGNVNLNGKTGALNINVSGSGGVKAKELNSLTEHVKLEGSGDVYLSTKDDLNATILGSGNVKYVGNPNVTVSKVGSGDISEIK